MIQENITLYIYMVMIWKKKLSAAYEISQTRHEE